MGISFGVSSCHFLVVLVLLQQLTAGLSEKEKVPVSAGLRKTGGKFSSMENGCVTSSSTLLEVGNSTSGNTVGATVYNAEACGDAVAGLYTGHWYQVEGIGGIIEASLCNNDTEFDSMISVWSGNCTNLTCVEGVDDSCGKQSQATFMSDINVTYSIFVHGWSGQTGNYTLTLSDVTPSSAPSLAPTISDAPSVSSAPSPEPTPWPTEAWTPAPTDCYGQAFSILKYVYVLWRGSGN